MDAGFRLARILVAYSPNPFCFPMRRKGCVAVIHAHLMETVEEASEFSIVRPVSNDVTCP